MGRKLQLHDIVGPFEAKPNLDHLRDACGATRMLRDDADRFWKGRENKRTDLSLRYFVGYAVRASVAPHSTRIRS